MWRSSVSLAIITLAVLLNYVDRFILAILVEPIRAELRLNDVQIGLLTGAAFALLYATAAIPIARLAERHSRVLILGVSVILWSAATAACGLASGFATLALARIFVGLGEAGAVAPSMSMISDLFSRKHRAGAMSIYGLGAAIGIAVAPLIGGALLPHFGWRGTLACAGLLGLPVALLLMIAVREPRRGQADGAEAPPPAPLLETLVALFRRRAFALAVPAFVCLALAQQSTLLWMPALLQRSFAVEPTALGQHLLIYQGAPLLIGTLLGGFITDALSRIDQRWNVWAPMAAALAAAPASVAIVYANDQAQALTLLVAPAFAQGFCIGPCYALVQNLAAVNARATASAVMTFSINLIGVGVGPLLLGVLSHSLSSTYADQSLRYAFLAVGPLYILAALVFFLISTTLKRDLADAGGELRPTP